MHKLPIKDRFAAFPTYNHPLLMNGRKVVLGYPGHLWTQGFDYGPVEHQLNALMLGAPDWRERARALHTRYIFWGREEGRAYAASAQPWRGKAAVVAEGFWGTIYDLDRPASATAPIGVNAFRIAGPSDRSESIALALLFVWRNRPHRAD